MAVRGRARGAGLVVRAAAVESAPAAKAAPAKKAKKAKKAKAEGPVFNDSRWVNGTWDLSQFKGSDGETDWDLVIDAEIERRDILERNPQGTEFTNPQTFQASQIPAWNWIKRFHLEEAERLNGRAAMVGYLAAGVIELANGTGLVEQQESFLGKLALHLVVFGCLIFRDWKKDIKNFTNLADEATFYDRQWEATWDGVERPED